MRGVEGCRNCLVSSLRGTKLQKQKSLQSPLLLCCLDTMIGSMPPRNWLLGSRVQRYEKHSLHTNAKSKLHVNPTRHGIKWVLKKVR